MRYLFTLVCLFWFLVVYTQNYNYVHYDTHDGLAGSTVYDVCQDADGFVWFATENGLSRYDGTRFTNFTVKDGLPDNEVLKVFADSKGRVWVGSLSKELAYYYKGKIYNKENDRLLNDSNLQINGFRYCEDLEGNLAVSNYSVIVVITKDDKVIALTSLPAFKEYKFSSIFVNKNSYEGGFIIVLDKNFYKLKGEKLIWFFRADKQRPKYFGAKVFPDGRTIYLEAPGSILGETEVNMANVYESTVDGAWAVDTINYRLSEHFLPGKRVSQTIDDSEGNTWFTTLGEGVFKLPSREMKTFYFQAKDSELNPEVFTVSGYEDKIFAGLGFSKLAVVQDKKKQQITDYSNELNKLPNALSTNRLYKTYITKDGDIFLGFDGFMARLGNGIKQFSNIMSIKSISELNRKELLVGNYAYVFKVLKETLQITDTVWSGRCTDVIFINGVYYVGTIEGLYSLNAQKQLSYLGNVHPSLRSRIVRIASGTDGELYVATADKGMVVLMNNKVDYILDDKNGLSSSICKALYLDENYIWLGTNKGLNRITKGENRQIVKYSTSDGLPSDIINDVLVQDSIIWVASPKGLTYFNENKIQEVSNCKLILLDIQQNGKATADSVYRLSYNDNKISFTYIAISQKSAGEIIYYYKLSSIDSAYQKTDKTELSYLSLPPGNYHFSLYAVNKFGKKSKPVEIDFIVTTPFWKTSWFYVFFVLLASAITAMLLSRRNKIIRKRLQEKSRFQRLLASVEQQALQAQMNPHFIFNCLNSIQQFMLTNDKEKANLYLTGFASLIRQTINISTRQSISIEEEVAYLGKYLEMEKMRFGEDFTYDIHVDPALLSGTVQIPSLLIQPYVENALRHGIRYKEDAIGNVQVNFTKKEEIIYCTVTDNGVGRKKAAEFKGIQHIEYQSKGTQLTAKRMRLLNMINDTSLQSDIIDLFDENDKPTGTEVIVKIPMLPQFIST